MKTLVLGDVCLDKYVLAQNEQEVKERLSAVDSQIKTIRKKSSWFRSPLPTEKSVLNVLKVQKKTLSLGYKQLDTSFLSMSNIVEYKEMKIHLPKFSVYPVFSKPKFTIYIRYRNNGELAILMSYEGRGYLPNDSILSLAKSTEIFKVAGSELKRNSYSVSSNGVSFSEFPGNYSDFIKHLKDLQRYNFREVSFSSRLNILVPEKTRVEIDLAEKVFGKDNLFFVAETKPDEWDIETKVYTDPLIMGVFGDKCYFVTSFNLTPGEYQVSKEFTSD